MKSTRWALAISAIVAVATVSPATGVEDFVSGPRWIGGQFLPAEILGLSVQGQALYASCANGQLCVLDLADPDHPQPVDTVTLPEARQRIVAQHDGFLYLAGDSTLTYVDARDPLHPRPAGVYPQPIAVRHLAIDHGFAAASTTDPGRLVFLDATDPAHLIALDQVDEPAEYVAIVGDVVIYSVTRSHDHQWGWVETSTLYAVTRRDLKNPRVVGGDDGQKDWSVSHVQGMEGTDRLYCRWFYDSGPWKVTPTHHTLTTYDVGQDATVTPRESLRIVGRGSINTGTFTPRSDGRIVVPFDNGQVAILDMTSILPALHGWAATGPAFTQAVHAADHVYGCAGAILHVLALGDLSHSLLGGYDSGFRGAACDGRRRAYTEYAQVYDGYWAWIIVQNVGPAGELTDLAWAEIPDVSGLSQGEVDLHHDLVVVSGAPTYTLDLDSSTPAQLHEQTLSFRDFAGITPEFGVAASATGFLVVDLRDPASLSLIASVPGSLTRVEPAPGASPFAVGVHPSGDARVFDLTHPQAPQEVARFGTNVVRAVPIDGSFLLAVSRRPVVDCLHARLDLYDLTIPAAPRLLGSLDVPGLIEDALQIDDRLYLACGQGGIVVVSIADPMQPLLIGGLAADDVRSLVRVDGDLLVTDQDSVERIDLDGETTIEFALAAFRATGTTGRVELSWRTAIAPAATEFRVHRVVPVASDFLPATRTADGWQAIDTLPPGFSAPSATYELQARLAPAQAWFAAATTTVTLDLPAASRLIAATPNPFNPQTVVRYELGAAATYAIRIHDARGRCVRHLAAGPATRGSAEITWDGRDDAGRALPTGTYLARLVTDTSTSSLKLTLVR